MDSSTPKVSGTPSRELIQAVVDGRADAADAWYRGEHPAVYRLCFGFLAEEAEAEDVAQDAMLLLFDRLPSYDPERPYRAWRDTVVLNLCRDRLRRSAARRRAQDGAAEAREECTLPDPHAEVERAELRRLLRESLGVLSPREREAFVLRDLEERPTAEVARILGIESGSVRTLLTLARRRLRARLGHLVPEGGGSAGG
jgi:RNA polymerase sigma-70 factor (ECF subfamily)